jgi:hypothetical protein
MMIQVPDALAAAAARLADPAADREPEARAALAGLRDDLGSGGVALLLADLEDEDAGRCRARLEPAPTAEHLALRSALARLAPHLDRRGDRELTSGRRAWAVDLLRRARAALGTVGALAALADLEADDAGGRGLAARLDRVDADRRGVVLRAFVRQADGHPDADTPAVARARGRGRDDPDRRAWAGHRPRARKR